jgi:hypothetical protein
VLLLLLVHVSSPKFPAALLHGLANRRPMANLTYLQARIPASLLGKVVVCNVKKAHRLVHHVLKEWNVRFRSLSIAPYVRKPTVPSPPPPRHRQVHQVPVQKPAAEPSRVPW